jgi:hypothetical protein
MVTGTLMGRSAGVAQWQCASLPSWLRGFDSHRPLQTVRFEHVFARLVDGYVQEKRAAGASARTAGHYREVLEQVLIPFCVDRHVKTPAELTPRHLNDLGAGLLDGTGTRSGRAISKATVHSYIARHQHVSGPGPR